MAEPTARNALRDTSVTFVVVFVLVAVFVQIRFTITGIGDVGGALVALLFIATPIVMAARRGEFIEDYGFRLEPLGRSLAIAAIAMLVIVPAFFGVYVAFFELACHSRVLAMLPMKGTCQAYGGLAALHAPTATAKLVEFFPLQLAVVGLPEELFFRGFMHGVLEVRFPPARKLLGGGIGWALVLSSLAFAAIHLPRDGWDPRALARFFPGLLFGWMKSSTRSITASTITHAGCNLLIYVLALAFAPV